jgi:hypothetical protein
MPEVGGWTDPRRASNPVDALRANAITSPVT